MFLEHIHSFYFLMNGSGGWSSVQLHNLRYTRSEGNKCNVDSPMGEGLDMRLVSLQSSYVLSQDYDRYYKECSHARALRCFRHEVMF